MGWNSGYRILEQNVIDLYNKDLLTKEILEIIIEPYKGTDCDSGGSQDLKTKDGKGLEELICFIMKPEEYEDVIKNPKYDEDYVNTEEDKCWETNDRAYALFKTIWRDKWEIW